MDKYKNFVKIEELKTLLREGKNEEALELCEGMDPRKIKDIGIAWFWPRCI